MNVEDFANRLRKRDKHLRRWANRWPTNAYRVYDWDIPEWAFAVDRYGEAVHLQHFTRRNDSEADRDARLDAATMAIIDVLEVAPQHVFTKERRRQKGGAQYERLDDEAWFTVAEDGLLFNVDLAGHLDTGLFLDHRELRRHVATEVIERGHESVANLFAYTGAFSVWAARAGATVTSVDLSNTYLEWAERNFRSNALDPAAHRFDRSDVTRWLGQEHQRGVRYDLIVLDPPTFSRSKKMVRDLDTQRDHIELIQGSRALLRPGGTLYFSTNFRDFQLDPAVGEEPQVVEITAQTLSEDYSAGIHRAFRIRNDSAA